MGSSLYYCYYCECIYSNDYVTKVLQLSIYACNTDTVVFAVVYVLQ